MSEFEELNAEVISVFPNKIKISVDDLENFQLAEEKLKVGSYLRIADNENSVLIAIIENFNIEVGIDSDRTPSRKYILESNPLGMIRNGNFERGGDTIAIPPKKVEPAKKDEIKKIFEEALLEEKRFDFATLSTDKDITVPVDGDKFFNKHIAIVGSTGSGKSHSVAKIVQNALKAKNGKYQGMNNSHIVIFDIHSEYKTAFPNAKFIDIDNLRLPYWLLNSDELQELFIDTEANDHNQRNIFKEAIVKSRKEHFSGAEEKKEKLHFDSPVFFEINDVLNFAKEKNEEMVEGLRGGPKAGPLNGKLSNFVSRLENKINDRRLEFLLGDKSKNISFEDTLKQLIGYTENTSNVTIIDLSGVPFEVLSITVSLISRILFEFGYYYKRLRVFKNPEEEVNNDIPLLLSCIQLSQTISNYAENTKNISEKINENPNQKFLMRTWLVRAGMIGAEYKFARKMFTQNLKGNSAWVNKVNVEEISNANIEETQEYLENKFDTEELQEYSEQDFNDEEPENYISMEM